MLWRLLLSLLHNFKFPLFSLFFSLGGSLYLAWSGLGFHSWESWSLWCIFGAFFSFTWDGMISVAAFYFSGWVRRVFIGWEKGMADIT